MRIDDEEGIEDPFTCNGRSNFDSINNYGNTNSSDQRFKNQIEFV